MEGMNKVYKVLRVEGEELKSVYAGFYTGTIFMENLEGVTYKEGTISYAPKSQGLLTAFGVLEEAIDFAKRNTPETAERMVIHEAVPLGGNGGALYGSGCPWSSSCSYPAILLGEEVWKGKPKEEWVDVTSSLIAKVKESKPDGFVFDLYDGDTWVALLGGGEGVNLTMLAEESYKLEVSKFGGKILWFRVFKRLLS